MGYVHIGWKHMGTYAEGVNIWGTCGGQHIRGRVNERGMYGAMHRGYALSVQIGHKYMGYMCGKCWGFE